MLGDHARCRREDVAVDRGARRSLQHPRVILALALDACVGLRGFVPGALVSPSRS